MPSNWLKLVPGASRVENVPLASMKPCVVPVLPTKNPVLTLALLMPTTSVAVAPGGVSGVNVLGRVSEKPWLVAPCSPTILPALLMPSNSVKVSAGKSTVWKL
jgi:hypothetical protein